MGEEEELDAIWEEHREITSGRLALVARAARAVAAGALDADLRREAGTEAHTIAGAAAIFGHAEVTRLARELERTFRSDRALRAEDGERLVALAEALREELDRTRK